MDHFSRTINFYRNAVAPILEFSTRSRLDITAELAAGKKVLDLGCADHDSGKMGRHSEWFLHGRLARVAKSIKGVDGVEESVRKMREQGFAAVVGDMENFDLGEKYEVIVVGQAIEHLTNFRGMLDSARRHLCEGGALVISTSNGGSLFYFLGGVLFGHETDSWDHTCMLSPTQITVLLQKCGFRTKRIILNQPYDSYPHDKLWMQIVSRLGNIVWRAACMFRRNFARELIVVAEPAEFASDEERDKARLNHAGGK